MAFTEITFSQAVDTTEWSCVTDTAGPDAESTITGWMQGHLNLSDMVADDELQITVYEKVVAGEAQLIYFRANPVGPQSRAFLIPAIYVKNGWDVTTKAITGTITVTGSIRVVS